MPPRTLADTVTFISFLLSRQPGRSAMGAILAAAASGKLTLLFAGEIADEIRIAIANRPDLSAKIAPARVDALIAFLDDVAQPLSHLRHPIPAVGRDPKDDYLIAHAVVAEADYLVSWDRDLLDLHQIDRVKIVSPPELLALLREGDAVGGSGDE